MFSCSTQTQQIFSVFRPQHPHPLAGTPGVCTWTGQRYPGYSFWLSPTFPKDLNQQSGHLPTPFRIWTQPPTHLTHHLGRPLHPSTLSGLLSSWLVHHLGAHHTHIPSTSVDFHGCALIPAQHTDPPSGPTRHPSHPPRHPNTSPPGS